MKNVAASVHPRLLNVARQTGRPFNEVLQYYGIERFLFRLAQSPQADRFILKGALTLLAWNTPGGRPTRDIDLLGRMANDLDDIRAAFAGVCRLAVEPDGVVFDPDSVVTEQIAEDADYHGVRVTFRGRLGTARIPMQIDIGFSDVITPGPIEITYPTLLGHDAPVLRAYNRETVVAEKFEAMVSLGTLNSRMKDFFDVWLLATNFAFDGQALSNAVRATFARRGTSLSRDLICFSPGFIADPAKAVQWTAFCRNAGLVGAPGAFVAVTQPIRAFMSPLVESHIAGTPFTSTWPRGGPWQGP